MPMIPSFGRGFDAGRVRGVSHRGSWKKAAVSGRTSIRNEPRPRGIEEKKYKETGEDIVLSRGQYLRSISVLDDSRAVIFFFYFSIYSFLRLVLFLFCSYVPLYDIRNSKKLKVSDVQHRGERVIRLQFHR